MGLLNGVKELFNKNIECGEDLDSHIVLFLKSKKYLYLGKNIIVRDNSACVVVHKGRACDIIMPGKYKISEEIIPECFSRAKVEKLKSKGKKIKKIRVNLYYINTTEFKDFDFVSKKPFISKSKELGKVKGKLCGKCTVRAIDPLLLIKYLTTKSGKINNKITIEEVSKLIGNKINKVFEKSKMPFEMLFSDRQKVNSVLNTEVEDAFDKNGLFVKNINLKSVDVAKKHQDKVNDYLAKHKKVPTTASIVTPAMGIGDNFKIPINIGNSYTSSQTTKTCNFCGYKNNVNSQVCINCGKKLN